MKLEVRSFLLDYIQDRLPEHADSKEAVITWLSENKRNLETAATRFLTKKQMPYSARLSLEQAWFPTRVYDNLGHPLRHLRRRPGHPWRRKRPQLVVRPLSAVLLSG